MATFISTLIVCILILIIFFSILFSWRFAKVSRFFDRFAHRSVGHDASDFSSFSQSPSDTSSLKIATRKPSSTFKEDLRSRFSVISAAAAAIFGVLGIKAWTMQALNSETYSQAADANSYTTVRTPASRGRIYDNEGQVIVGNRDSLIVLADSDVEGDADTIARLSAVLGIPRNIIRQRILDTSYNAQSQRVVVDDASIREVAFITEHSDAFPGVRVDYRAVRDYPFGALAAHVVGYTGTATEDNLAHISAGREIEAGDSVGQSGIEEQYDSVLAGDHGQRIVMTDAEGNIVEVLSETKPTKGSDVHLTINVAVQYACDSLLAKTIAPSGTIGYGTGTGGAIVVMDVRDGGIVALSNYPTFSPETFTGGIPTEIWEKYNEESSYTPLLNRSIAGLYPAASTFKAFSGLAGLECGLTTQDSAYYCTGKWDGFSSGTVQNCWDHNGHGGLTFRQGIVESCDVVFYEIGKGFYINSSLSGNDEPNLSDTAMQDVIEHFGFGSATGIDISGENEGRVPTPEWKKVYFSDDAQEAQWQGGDFTNMAIGQGYVLVTPLQLAVAYAGVATGKILKPHLLKAVYNNQGEEVVSHTGEVLSELPFDESNLEIIRDALHGVATENSSIAPLFSSYGIDAAAKTGTAEVTSRSGNDTAWFACYGPYEDPHYVVVVVIEEGGGGTTVAAPIGAEILNTVLEVEAGDASVDIGTISGSTGKSVTYVGTVGSSRTD